MLLKDLLLFLESLFVHPFFLLLHSYALLICLQVKVVLFDHLHPERLPPIGLLHPGAGHKGQAARPTRRAFRCTVLLKEEVEVGILLHRFNFFLHWRRCPLCIALGRGI